MALPPLASLRGYKLSNLPHDFVAGLVIAALSIPVAMGYAKIAGLSPVYGLYASILPAIVFALVTSARSIVFGLDSAAVAVTGGVIVSAGVVLDSAEAFQIMPMLTLLVAAFLMLFAFTRVGDLIHYVPEPVMNGFILGIAVMIIYGQIPELVGAQELDLTNLGGFVKSINIPSLVLSVSALAALFFFKKKAPNIPGTLVVLVFGMAYSIGFGLEAQGVEVLGEIPKGLPSFELPEMSGIGAFVMISGAFSIAITCAMESLLALNTFSMREGQRPHGNRELLSLSLGNAASSAIGCPPCSVSLSRTAAATNAGGRSQLASLFSALFIAAFLLVLSPHLENLPEPVLSSIVVYAMINVVEFRDIKRYAKKLRVEFGVVCIVAITVIVFDAIAGVVVGVIVSLITHFLRSRITGREKLVGFEAVGDEGMTSTPDNMAVIYLHGFLSFININKKLQEAEELIEEGVDTIILEISGVTSVDATASESIRRFIRMMMDRGVQVRIVRSLALANDQYTQYELRRMMKKMSVYPSVQSAIENVNRMKRKHMLNVPVDQAEKKDSDDTRK